MLRHLTHCASGVDFPALLRLLKGRCALLLGDGVAKPRLKVTASLEVCAITHMAGLCLERGIDARSLGGQISNSVVRGYTGCQTHG